MTFTDIVKKHFGYLKSYGFKVTFESNSEVRPQTDGVVEYISNTIQIVIDSEIGSASVWFYRIIDGKKFYLTPIDIFEYLQTNNEEKDLLLSVAPKDQLEARALFNRKFLLNQPDWTAATGNSIEKLELSLKNYAKWLREHADLCLTGNFSQWPKFYEFKILRAKAERLRRGDNELVYTEVQDDEGNWKLTKQSVFKDQLEHIEKLKKEFPVQDGMS